MCFCIPVFNQIIEGVWYILTRATIYILIGTILLCKGLFQILKNIQHPLEAFPWNASNDSLVFVTTQTNLHVSIHSPKPSWIENHWLLYNPKKDQEALLSEAWAKHCSLIASLLEKCFLLVGWWSCKHLSDWKSQLNELTGIVGISEKEVKE